MRLLFILLAALGLLPPAAAAQEAIGQPIVEVVVEQEGQVVTDPLIRGLIETTAGEPLSMFDVRETIGHLMNLRRFEDVRPVAEAAPGGVRLRYVLLPLHPVDRVEFRGTLGLSESDLRRIITDRFGRAPATGRAAEAAETLRRTYRDRGFPEARVATRIEESHNPDRATMIFEIEAGRRARIAAVQIFQLDEDQPTTIIGTPDIRVGDFYDQQQVNDELREWEERLRERGYYEARASHGANIADDSAYVTVNIARGPLVTVAFAGDPLSASERARLVPVRAEASADEDLLEDARTNIERYLHAQGYRDAAAPYTRTEAPGELTITFTVTRGPRYVVETLNVKGNSGIFMKEIREVLGLEPGEPFVRAALQERAATLQNLYRSRGYTRAKVDAAEAVLPTGGGDRSVEVNVLIEEGPRTLVRSIAFEGNSVLSETDARGLITFAPGDAYSQVDILNSRDALELEYRNRGYEAVTVTFSVTPGENDTQADVVYRVTEGAQSRIDHIIIVGNERTSTETIRDELLFREGDPVGYSALINSRARLAALGLFRRVDVQALQHTGESRRDVLIQVEEADPTTLGYGGGLEGGIRRRAGEEGAPEDRLELAPRAFVEVGRRNLWGKNRSVNLFARVSLRSTDVRVDEAGAPLELVESNPGFNEYRIVASFREPRLFSTPADLLVTNIVEQAIRTTFNFSRRIVRAETGARLRGAVSATGGYSFERTKLFDELLTEEEKEREELLIDRYFPEIRLSKFTGSLFRDTRDDPLDASRGTFMILDGDVAARAIGSEVGFVRMFAQASTYYQLPTGLRAVLALSGRIGAARGFPREVAGVPEPVQDLPASERFFAGGDTSVRGFALDSLGSEGTLSENGFPLGGNSTVVLNGELRVNMFGPWQAVGFFDAGNVFRRAGNLDLTDLRPSAGIGIRYQQFGTIRLDWGFNLDRRDIAPGIRERGSVFHISLGQAF